MTGLRKDWPRSPSSRRPSRAITSFTRFAPTFAAAWVKTRGTTTGVRWSSPATRASEAFFGGKSTRPTTAGDVTLLINNAGALNSFNVLTSSQADLDADFGVQVHGMLGVIRAFLPVLERAAGGATIVNVLSLTSLASFPPLGGYSASKAAAYSMTQALRPELKQKQIEILAVLPGPIDTDMVKDLPMPKTSPADTAKELLAGIARGDEEIFPDPMAQQMGALWNKSHKEYERAIASI